MALSYVPIAIQAPSGSHTHNAVGRSLDHGVRIEHNESFKCDLTLTAIINISYIIEMPNVLIIHL